MLLKPTSLIPTDADRGRPAQEHVRREPAAASALFRQLLIPIGAHFYCQPHFCPILDLVETWKSDVALLTAGDSSASDSAPSSDLTAFARRLEDAGSPRVRILSSAEPPTIAIEQATRHCESSLLLMSPRLHEQPSSWFGTVLQRLIRRPPVPLMVMKSQQPLSPKTILCLIEESDPALRAVRLSAGLARELHSRLTLLNVIPPSRSHVLDETTIWDFHSRQSRLQSLERPPVSLSPAAEDIAIPLADQTAELLRQILNEGYLDGMDYAVRIAAGSPAAQVALHARTGKCGLIVSGAIPRSGCLFGYTLTTAEAVAEASDLPVLVVP
ncbi:MAG: universal stress protein [bacterium]|nr:universal stress protein [bacterium]